jgi:hypothetical protein
MIAEIYKQHALPGNPQEYRHFPVDPAEKNQRFTMTVDALFKSLDFLSGYNRFGKHINQSAQTLLFMLLGRHIPWGIHNYQDFKELTRRKESGVMEVEAFSVAHNFIYIADVSPIPAMAILSSQASYMADYSQYNPHPSSHDGPRTRILIQHRAGATISEFLRVVDKVELGAHPFTQYEQTMMKRYPNGIQSVPRPHWPKYHPDWIVLKPRIEVEKPKVTEDDPQG